jgi:hypothetical protein
MGVRWPSTGNNTIQLVHLPATVVSVVVRTPPFNITLDNQQVLILWYIVVTPGADITSLDFALFRGSDATGVEIDQGAAVSVTGGIALIYAGNYVDTPGIVAEQQWCATLIPAGGVAASVVQDASIALIAL